MDAIIQKKPTMFRLDSTLLSKLKKMAKSENRSLNNFVECILKEVVKNDSSHLTLSAIQEAKSGSLKNSTPVDTSSVEAMFKSAGL